MSRPAKSSQIGLTVLIIVLYAVLTGVWYWRLTPQPEEKMDPQRTGRLERLTQFLVKAPAGLMQPAIMSVALKPDDELKKIESWLHQSDLGKMRQLTVQESAIDTKLLRTALLVALIEQSPEMPLVESHLMVAASGDRLDDELKLYVMEKLARLARQQMQPETAILILERACALPCSRWDTVVALVDVCVPANRSTAALRAVSTWMKLKGNEADPAMEEARNLEVSLLLGLNRAEEALRGQLDVLQRYPAETRFPETVLERALLAAKEAKQESKMIPWLEKHLATYSEHQQSWQELASANRIAADYQHWLEELAILFERTGRAEKAADVYQKLAACGRESALHRLCDLATATSRVRECNELMKLWMRDPKRSLVVAEAALTYPLAGNIVANTLRAEPANQELHFRITQKQALASKPAQALESWSSYLARFPGDLAARREFIELLQRSTGFEVTLIKQLAAIPSDLRQPAESAQLAILQEWLGSSGSKSSEMAMAERP